MEELKERLTFESENGVNSVPLISRGHLNGTLSTLRLGLLSKRRTWHIFVVMLPGWSDPMSLPCYLSRDSAMPYA